MTRTQRQALATIRLKVYGQLPTIACKGLCTDSCGPISMTQLEHLHLTEVSREEARLHRRRTCVYLERGRCSVYASRPLICREYGLVDGLLCEHGCKPSRVLTTDEAVLRAREATTMKEGYPVEGTRAVRIREEDVLVYVRRAGHAAARIEWCKVEGRPDREACAIFEGEHQIDAVTDDTRAGMLLCFLAVYAHKATGCGCKGSGKPCPAALSAAFDLGRGLDG